MNKRLYFYFFVSLVVVIVFVFAIFNETNSKNMNLSMLAFASACCLLAAFEVFRRNKETCVLRSELQNCMDELQFSQMELQNVLNFLNSGVVKIIFDGENKRHIQWANDGFYNLTGYGKAGYDSGMDDNPHKILHPDDMQWVFEAFNAHVQRRDSLTLEYRVIHKNGHIVWLYVKSSFVGEQDGFPVFISIMLDITEQKLMREEIILNQKRYEFINSISKELLFEYDLKRDLMKTFGASIEASMLPKEMYGFLKNIYNVDIIHPEDRDIVAKLLNTVSEDATPINSPRFRMRLASGEHEWHYACYSTMRSADETILLGKLVNIHQSTELITRLEHLSATDSMTGLFNKAAFEERVIQILATGHDKMHALLVLDIDNFKQINDSFGHPFGDMVIVGIVRTMRETLRGNDIIGRIGGDEFAVLLTELCAEQQVAEIITRYMEKLKTMRISPHHDRTFSTSIGVSLYPVHATSYKDLFAASDCALYAVKNSCKGDFAFASVPIS